jgi:short-subunit dehydrogenase
MVTKGAKYLGLMSHSGLSTDKFSTDKFKEFVDNLEQKGVDIYCLRCDITDASLLRAVIDYCNERILPIKGCIQAAALFKV